MERKTRQERTQQNIDSILEASIRLFNEQGYTETTMKDISQETGISYGSIYHLFDSKQEILREIYRRYINVPSDLLENVAEKVKDPYPVLLQYMLDIQALWEYTGPMMISNKYIWDTERTQAGCSTIMRNELTEFMRAAQAAGTLRADINVQDAVEFFFTLQRGILYGWAIRDDFDMQSYARKFWAPVIQAFVRGTLVI